jgi:calcium uniporter protein, mitochondrial
MTPRNQREVAIFLIKLISGSLIPTKSHLFRLTLPLPSFHSPKDQSVNEVSFLLHPSQHLFHLSSLIVAELPHRPNNQGQTQQLVTFHGFQDPDPEISGDEEDGVRWSGGTELGEFMRDAAKVREFTIKLNLDDNTDWEIQVSVPNFEGCFSPDVY